MKEKTKIISARIKESSAKKLKEIATQTNYTVSNLINLAIERMLDKLLTKKNNEK